MNTRQKGQTLTEYVVIVSLVTIVAIPAFSALGQSIASKTYVVASVVNGGSVQAGLSGGLGGQQSGGQGLTDSQILENSIAGVGNTISCTTGSGNCQAAAQNFVTLLEGAVNLVPEAAQQFSEGIPIFQDAASAATNIVGDFFKDLF